MIQLRRLWRSRLWMCGCVVLAAGTLCVARASSTIGETASMKCKEPSRGSASEPAAEMPPQIQHICDQILAAFADGRATAALDLVQEHSLIPAERMRPAREATIDLLAGCESLLGPRDGYEPVRVEKAGQRVYRVSYLLRFRRCAACVFLTFYVNDQECLVVDYHMDQDLGGLFGR